MKGKTSKFQEVCPRKLDSLPCASCPLALERINAIKAESASERKKKDMVEPDVGCPWFVASAEHHHCFWVYNQYSNNEPLSDRETCDMLMLSKSVLEKEFDSAIGKLSSLKDTAVIQDLKEMVQEAAEARDIDYTAYFPDEFRSSIATTQLPAEATEESPKKLKVKHPTGLPLHRDKRKVDLYGLYGKQAKERAKKALLSKGSTKDETKKNSK